MTDPAPLLVFKLTTVDEWSAAIVDGAFTGSPVDLQDGFIHLSTLHQVAETAAKYFGGVEDLCLVAFDAASLGTPLMWEASRGGDLFPHYYGELSAFAALWVRPVPLDAYGIPVVGEVVSNNTPTTS